MNEAPAHLDSGRKLAADRPPVLSLIIPTRQRVESLGRLLDSLSATARAAELFEVVLVVDADDAASQGVQHQRLCVRHTRVAPGCTMGTLNSAGYQACRGQFIMLLNDDVIAHSAGWDERLLAVARRHADGIVLVHVNDLIFGESLCTFPLVPRRFATLAGDICPTDYERYRIDDHIHEIFLMLAVLGHDRIVYVPDVVFEHLRYDEDPSGLRRYVYDRDVLQRDARRFDAGLRKRRLLAARLLAEIEGKPASRGRLQVLEALDDFAALRHQLAQMRRGNWVRRLSRFMRERGPSGLLEAAWRRVVRTSVG